MRITAAMETVAASRNTNFIIVSLAFFIRNTPHITKVTAMAVTFESTFITQDYSLITSLHTVRAPVKMSLTCSVVRPVTGLSLLTITAIPSIAIVVDVRPVKVLRL